ncbi:hypothetical protein MKZ38_005588 [Zalerion maritima]|uniref:Uncharacterized protein n=1 Tax=Zalerion maritima TaxID=339359 RepID=A0AAD5WQA3_9PEZI|nr:hypothetical protein MKZ38_005588 [Zalerion maritima]
MGRECVPTTEPSSPSPFCVECTLRCPRWLLEGTERLVWSVFHITGRKVRGRSDSSFRKKVQWTACLGEEQSDFEKAHRQAPLPSREARLEVAKAQASRGGEGKKTGRDYSQGHSNGPTSTPDQEPLSTMKPLLASDPCPDIPSSHHDPSQTYRPGQINDHEGDRKPNSKENAQIGPQGPLRMDCSSSESGQVHEHSTRSSKTGCVRHERQDSSSIEMCTARR